LFREENGAGLGLQTTKMIVLQTKGFTVGLLGCGLICGAGRNWLNCCPGDGPGKKGDVASFGLEKKWLLVENRLKMLKSDYIK
jgi:hypothetical protein